MMQRAFYNTVRGGFRFALKPCSTGATGDVSEIIGGQRDGTSSRCPHDVAEAMGMRSNHRYRFDPQRIS